MKAGSIKDRGNVMSRHRKRSTVTTLGKNRALARALTAMVDREVRSRTKEFHLCPTEMWSL